MPAAAVIPAPIAYIKVVAVKKLVVGSVSYDVGSPLAVSTGMSCGTSCRWRSGPADLCRFAEACRGFRPPIQSRRGALD